jgi:hypothetical protein
MLYTPLMAAKCEQEVFIILLLLLLLLLLLAYALIIIILTFPIKNKVNNIGNDDLM